MEKLEEMGGEKTKKCRQQWLELQGARSIRKDQGEAQEKKWYLGKYFYAS